MKRLDLSSTESDLKSAAIEATFITLDLEKRRKLIPKLLQAARIINGTEIPEIEPRFTKWLCSGKKKLFTTEEAEYAWQMWIFFKERAYESYVGTYEDDGFKRITYFIIPYDNSHPEEYDSQFFTQKRGDDGTGRGHLSKRKFFSWILENTAPDCVMMASPYDNNTPMFEFLDIDDEAKEDLERYGWSDIFEP